MFLESTASSSDIVKKRSEEKQVTFELFKGSLTDESKEEPADEKRERLVIWFKKATFEELLERAISAKCPSGEYHTLTMFLLDSTVCV